VCSEVTTFFYINSVSPKVCSCTIRDPPVLYSWNESRETMVTSGENIVSMIDMIRDATKCDDWAADVFDMVTKTTDDKRKVPKYVWSFFDMTAGFDFGGKEGTKRIVPWIQKQMTVERYNSVAKRIGTLLITKESTPLKGTKMVEGNTNLGEDERLNEYYDSLNQSTTWGVLQLFLHRTIRKVGRGNEEDNKYCFWPLSQPWVNHRSVELDLIEGSNGYIDNLRKSTTNEWESQQALCIPYCVSSENKEDKDKIKMAYMINSGDSKTDANEYVREQHTNMAAGNVHCLGLTTEAVNGCWKAVLVSDRIQTSDVLVVCFNKK
jgi:hypothetical protein